MSYPEILSSIYALGRFGINPGLTRITKLLDALGNPQNAFATVHVVGTNGKGSTASLLSSILNAAGYRTGLFTSPHLISFTERFRLGGREIDEEVIAPLAERALAAAPEGTTFFELVTALAALCFAEGGIEIAVMEAGMGGGLDATNAMNGLLSLITPISLDHTDYLGSRVEEIAWEKAGICKPGAPIISARQLPDAAQAIARRASELRAPLYLCGEHFDSFWREGRLSYQGLETTLNGMKPGLSGRYQRGNVALALAAAELLGPLGFPVSREAMTGGVERANWPGRMELFQGPPRVLLDGAHNPAGAVALADALSEITYGRLFLVTGVMSDKELSGLLAPLLPLAHTVFAVAPAIERAVPAAQLAAFCRAAGALVQEAGTVGQGLELARAAAGAEDLVLVCGSLFTVGEARSILLARDFEPFRG